MFASTDASPPAHQWLGGRARRRIVVEPFTADLADWLLAEDSVFANSTQARVTFVNASEAELSAKRVTRYICMLEAQGYLFRMHVRSCGTAAYRLVIEPRAPR